VQKFNSLFENQKPTRTNNISLPATYYSYQWNSK